MSTDNTQASIKTARTGFLTNRRIGVDVLSVNPDILGSEALSEASCFLSIAHGLLSKAAVEYDAPELFAVEHLVETAKALLDSVEM